MGLGLKDHPGPPPARLDTSRLYLETCCRCDRALRFCRYTKVNGVEEFGDQCLDCGSRVGKWTGIKKALEAGIVFEPIPDFDWEIKKRDWPRRSAMRQRIFAEAKEKQGGAWRDWYDRYLSSSAWGRKRQDVFDRCDATCEACGQNAATEVHHLTYDRVGYEDLTDLVGVCRRCHELIHGGAF